MFHSYVSHYQRLRLTFPQCHRKNQAAWKKVQTLLVGKEPSAEPKMRDLPFGVIKHGWEIPCQWRCLAGKIIRKWWIFQLAIFDCWRIIYSIEQFFGYHGKLAISRCNVTLITSVDHWPS